MKIKEITKKPGTYVGVRFHKDTKKAIRQYIENNNIPNSVKEEKLHTTVLYSRKHVPDLDDRRLLKLAMFGTPTKFEIYPSQPDGGGETSNCLVLEFTCPELVDRHNYLVNTRGGTHDFDDYKTHITFSYNVGDLDIKQLPPFDNMIIITEEYSQELNDNWVDEND